MLIPSLTSGGGMSSTSSSPMTDMSRVVQSTGAVGTGAGSVNIDGEAAATLSRPWWMGGADWESQSPVADSGPAGMSWGAIGLGVAGLLAAGVLAWAATRG